MTVSELRALQRRADVAVADLRQVLNSNKYEPHLDVVPSEQDVPITVDRLPGVANASDAFYNEVGDGLSGTDANNAPASG